MQTRNGQIRPPVERRQHHDDDSGFGRVPAFLAKTFDLVGDRENSDIVSWEDNGQSFIIWQPAEFSRDLLPQYFKHSNLASFVRQLNTYGFQKASPDRWEFHHPNFKRAHPEQLSNIPRRRTAHKPAHTVSEGFVDHGLVAQVHALKQDKRMIMLELLKLQQTQERAQKEAEQLSGRLLRTEQNQQRLMSCLAAAVQDPSILRNMLAATSERGALADSPSIAGKKRARSWQDDSTDSGSDTEEEAEKPAGQLVTRATADALWPRASRQRSASLTHQVPMVGSLPAEAVKAPINSSDGTDRFSFMPVSDGVAKAVSPFAVSQGQADAPTVLQVNQVAAGKSSEGKAPAPGAAPLSLQSTDLILPKTSATLEDGNWPMNNSLSPIPSEWTRPFDVIGSQPSWTFAVGQGMESVH